jgi:hypothetical protein
MNHNLTNQRGHIILFILIGMLALILLLPTVMAIFQPADFIIRIILAFLLFTTVRQYLGNNAISLIVTGILIYLLVIKHAYISASVTFLLLVLLSFGAFSVVIWGIGTALRPKH